MKHRVVSSEELFFSTFDLCWCLETEERRKVFLIPHAHAAKLNTEFLSWTCFLVLSLSLGWRFCELSLTISKETAPYLQAKEPHKPLVELNSS